MTVAGLESLGAWVWGASWRAAVVVVVVLILRLVLGRRMSPRMRCGLWVLVAARLVMVWAPQGSWSLFGVLERMTSTPTHATNSGAQRTPNQATGVRVTVGYPDEMPAVGAPVQSAIAPIERPWKWGRIAAGIWFGGAIVLLCRAALSHLAIGRRIAAAPVVDDPHLLNLLERCSRDMRVGRPVRIRVTDAIAGPALWGVVRPTILLPPGLADRLSADQLRFVFLHELAHVRRHDVLVEWLLAVLTAVHWFNPAIWLAAHLYRADREVCRDQMVLRATGMERRRDYGHALLALLELAQRHRAGSHLAVAMLGDKGRLEQRIGMIAQLRSAPARWGGAVLLVGLTAVAWVLLTNPKQPDRHSSSTAATTTVWGTDRAAADAVLNRRIPEMEFRGERLDQTIDMLRDLSGANIFVEWGKLAAAGVARETPITARMRNVSLAKVLNTVLSDAGGGNIRLGFSMDGGVIRVSTAEDLEVFETRVYDIRDLLVEVPDFDPDKPPKTQQSRAERVAALAKLIRETVDPTSWTPTRPGSIAEDHGQLVVAQTAENHAGLGRLLDQLRETRQIQIVTQTRFVSFDPTALAAADPAWQILRSVGEARQSTKAGGATASPLYLSPEQTTALLAEIARRDAATLTAPRITTFNGQRAFAKVATQRAYVGDLNVKRDDSGAFKSYDPVVASAESGMTVDLQATASADRKYLTVTVRPKLSKLVAMHDVPFANVPVDHPAGMRIPTIQRPELLQSESRVTISIPDGQTLVLGGGEDVGLLDIGEGAAKPKAGHRMYILVTPKLIMARAATE